MTRLVPYPITLAVCATLAACPPPHKDPGGEGEDEIVLISAEEHAAHFPITEGEIHALGVQAFNGPLECASCHKNFRNFANFECVSCHQEDAESVLNVHREIAGFGIADFRCLECHPDGYKGEELGGEYHDINDFPINELTPHGDAAYVARIPAGETNCTACHASVNDRSDTLCAECHAADAVPLVDAHSLIPLSYAADNPSCKACHGTTPIPPEMNPADAHNAFFVVVPDHHTARTCSACHQANQVDPKPWTIDWAQNTCLDCHLP
jgi:hypothetical protein